ncbi:serine hydrolase domain-containing protein [Dongshaea marina]|uniref:serine hydrolase domain-containing protein n=1 Tax=Dongshaea marina TaxID=2047966 RepID=UPI000D3E7658|nr:serine hydrolase domain-containing protein [Dongshaea marina]
MKTRIALIFLPTFLTMFFIGTCHGETLNSFLINAMKAYRVPVVGYAIIDDGRIIDAQTVSIDPHIKTSPDSLFQAASISKSITAYAILSLVNHKNIDLNASANKYLKGWKIDNKYNKNNPILIRNLLDMTSGVSVSGFAGYPQGHPLPNLLQILNGAPPSNNLPIKVQHAPGTRYQYSGGAFQVLQKIITDVTNKSFASYIEQKLFTPLRMENSTYHPAANNTHIIPGFSGWDLKMLPGGWYNYACLGAGGVWSTPTDLAKFALNISDSLHGKDNGILKKTLAEQMLTRQKNTDYGLGVVVGGKGKDLYFWKSGHNYGYHSQLIMFPNKGKGAVIMTNSETGDEIINYMMPIIALKYSWPYYFPFFDELVEMPKH